MKTSIGFSVIGAVILGSLLSGRASACNYVLLGSLNGASSTVNVGLSMNSTPADSLSLSVAPGAYHTDFLPIGSGSSAPLTLQAMVSLGTLQATCSTSISTSYITGLCTTGEGANVKVVINSTPGTTGSTDSHNGKGNGNAWGTYQHCFKTHAEWQAWKDNPATPSHMGTSSGWCPGDSIGGTPATLSCQFVPLSSL